LLEPPLATVAVAERRQRAVRALAAVLERETQFKTASHERLDLSPRLTGELVVGGVFAAVRSRMLERPGRSLAVLAPSLMSFILTSYATVDTASELGLPVRATYRTTRVLRAIAAAARSNNREIAEAAGLRDEGQTSKLLTRLERRGLIENVGLGAAYGEPNAWLLTGSGERVLEAASDRRATTAEAQSRAGAFTGRPVGGAA
jgi:hypothetical protein